VSRHLSQASAERSDAFSIFSGLWVTLAFQFLQLVLLVGMTLYFKFKNRRVQAGIDPAIGGRVGFYYTI
jgi:hypothetical protein